MTLQTAYEAASTRYDHAEQMYQRCGNSGVLLPRISLGLWKGFGGNRSLSECQDLLHTAFDHGIVHFDLANNYGPPYGSAEENFGRVMQTFAKNEVRLCRCVLLSPLRPTYAP